MPYTHVFKLKHGILCVQSKFAYRSQILASTDVTIPEQKARRFRLRHIQPWLHGQFF